MRKIGILILCLIFFNSTKEIDVINEELANSIFNPYFDIFKIEAERRGYDFNNYEIEFYLGDIIDENIAGFADPSSNKVVIDRENWNRINSNQKEALVFHELGHSILKRFHLNTKTESGECLSYMRGKVDFCFRNLYSNLWREYYLDELFDPRTTLPNWYITNNNYTYNYINKRYLIQEMDNSNGLYNLEINSDTIQKFVLEIKFQNWSSISDPSLAITTDINLNGIYFISQPRLKAYIAGNYSIAEYLKKTDYNFKEDIKVTIRKNNNVYQFFLDEELLHITDSDYLESNLLEIDFSPEIKMDIELFTFE